MKPWFERYPARLERELEALEKAGFAYEVDNDLKAAGRIQIKVDVPYEGEVFKVLAIFPFSYPYTPFDLFSPDVPDGRHKAPYLGKICFLHDIKSYWSMRDHTLARILKREFITVINENRNPSNDPNIEALDASPITFHIPCQDNECILVPDFDIPREHKYGYAELAFQKGYDPNKFLRGHIRMIRGVSSRSLLYEIGDDLPGIQSLLPECSTIPIRWVRLDAPPVKLGNNILDEAIQLWHKLSVPQYKGGPDIIGLIIPEETAHNVVQDNWVFVRRAKVSKEGPKKGRIQGVSYTNIRADILDSEVFGARIPTTAPLTGKKVVIIGCGALGSTIALHLGRFRLGHLVLVDRDFLQTANHSRWPSGADASGVFKAIILQQRITRANPFIKVTAIPFELGGFLDVDPGKEAKIMSTIFDEADLIIDATAEYTASHLITDSAKEFEIPCVHVTGTHGSYGGIVSRFMPGNDSFCWGCLQEAIENEKEGDNECVAIAPPPASKEDGVQIRGCFDPAFTGTGFDMDHIALAAVRLAVATLCRESCGGYPDFDWNVAVISLWDQKSAMPISPKWKTYTPGVHPCCPKHG